MDHALHAAFGLGLLFTIGWTSHAGASGRGLLIIADLGHLIAAVVWAGAVVYLAWLPLWSGEGARLRSVVAGVSRVGLYSVLLLFATGLYASVVHLFGPTALASTAYGRVLLYKLLVIAVILTIAAMNRWWLMPALALRGVSATLRSLVRLESLLLIVVLALTGLLTGRDPVPNREPRHEEHQMEMPVLSTLARAPANPPAASTTTPSPREPPPAPLG